MSNSSTTGYGVNAVLGPTNTGKTHMAIERMVAHETGVIGLPLRLLAREVYGRICDLAGVANVSLVTGEERISPKTARYQVCTVEAMPERTDADFVAIDEVQLATDLERGHFFTDRIMNLRGKHETMLLGSDTMIPVLKELLPGVSITTRPRMSVLSYAGSKKISRMPTRTAVVAFSANEVYAIAEFLRRERGGAAVVTGSLSPRTRNAQVSLYQSGDVDFLVATDAIGMGLNLDVNHVAFAQDSKFDGYQYRRLTAAELAQVAGRAGRYKRDGTFGVTGHVQPFDPELVESLETHLFEPAKVLTWRNRDLDFSSISSLQSSLEQPSNHRKLMRAPSGTDIVALDNLSRNPKIRELTIGEEDVMTLWEVAKTPDYRKISPASHSDILAEVYTGLMKDGHIREDWFAGLVNNADNTHGEIDALSARIASIRTCTYLSNRDRWLEKPDEWREKTREVEDRLSDALHETLTKRFIDRRTSILMKRLKENQMLEADISDDGTVTVEGMKIGTLKAFRFVADGASNKDAKALDSAASKALSSEITKRAERLAAAPNSDFALSNDGSLRWLGEVVAKLAAGDRPLKPRTIVLADEHLTGPNLGKVQQRLERWVSNQVNTLLKPLADLENNSQLNGIARGLAYQLVESLGSVDRSAVVNDVKALDQEMRGFMRQNGVRFGAYNIFLPVLLKPAPIQLICLLWAIAEGKTESPGLVEIPELSAAGRTSVAVDPAYEPHFYQLSGFRVIGKKAVRLDILERLADLVRPATMWRPDSGTAKPDGAIDGRLFYVTPAMMSILGATHEDMEVILSSLGYKSERRLKTAVLPPEAVAPPQPVTEPEAEPKPDAETQVPEEDPTMLVWRYGGTKRKHSKKHSSDRPRNHDGKNKNKNKPKHAGAEKPVGKKRQKAPDPDSPFAALASLKSDLENRGD